MTAASSSSSQQPHQESPTRLLTDLEERSKSSPAINVSMTDDDAMKLGLITLINRLEWRHTMNKIEASPKEAKVRQTIILEGHETKGFPLHLAVSKKPPKHVIDALLKAYPDAIKAREDKWGRLPLHLACIFTASAQVLKALLDAYDESLRITDKAEGRLPVHYACLHGSPFEISLLVSAEQRALVFKDSKGKTPMDLAHESSNPHREAILKRLEDRTKLVTDAMIQKRKKQQKEAAEQQRRMSEEQKRLSAENNSGSSSGNAKDFKRSKSMGNTPEPPTGKFRPSQQVADKLEKGLLVESNHSSNTADGGNSVITSTSGPSHSTSRSSKMSGMRRRGGSISDLRSTQMKPPPRTSNKNSSVDDSVLNGRHNNHHNPNHHHHHHHHHNSHKSKKHKEEDSLKRKKNKSSNKSKTSRKSRRSTSGDPQKAAAHAGAILAASNSSSMSVSNPGLNQSMSMSNLLSSSSSTGHTEDASDYDSMKTPKLKNGRASLSAFIDSTKEPVQTGSSDTKSVGARMMNKRNESSLGNFLTKTSSSTDDDDEELENDDHKSMGAMSLPVHMEFSGAAESNRIASAFMFDDSSEFSPPGDDQDKVVSAASPMSPLVVAMDTEIAKMDEQIKNLDVRKQALQHECQHIQESIHSKQDEAERSRDLLSSLQKKLTEIQSKIEKEQNALTLAETGIQLQQETLALHEIKIKAVDSEKLVLADLRNKLTGEREDLLKDQGNGALENTSERSAVLTR